MKLRLLAGAMTIALGMASVVSAQETMPSDSSLQAERIDVLLFMNILGTGRPFDTSLFEEITLTKAQKEAYHKLITSTYADQEKYPGARWPGPVDDAMSSWQYVSRVKFERAYLDVLTPAQQALFLKNLATIAKNYRPMVGGDGKVAADASPYVMQRYTSWARTMTDSLERDRYFGVQLLSLNVPSWLSSRKNTEELLQGITWTKAQEAAYRKLIASQYAKMRELILSYTSQPNQEIAREEIAAKAPKYQALQEQYRKDYRAVLTPAQQTLFDAHVVDLRAELCKQAKAQWETKKMEWKVLEIKTPWVNKDHSCDDLLGK